MDDTATDSEEEKKHRRRRGREPKPSEPQEKEQDEKKLTLPGLFVNTNLDEEDASGSRACTKSHQTFACTKSHWSRNN